MGGIYGAVLEKVEQPILRHIIGIAQYSAEQQ